MFVFTFCFLGFESLDHYNHIFTLFDAEKIIIKNVRNLRTVLWLKQMNMLISARVIPKFVSVLCTALLFIYLVTSKDSVLSNDW